MANVTLKLLRVENTGSIYADLAKPDMTVRFRNSSAQKTLNGVNVQNYLSETIYNDKNAVTVGGVPVVDALSARLRLSGTKESAPRLAQFLRSMAAQVEAWGTEGVWHGFNPTTAPVILD